MKPVVKKFWKSLVPESMWKKILSAAAQLVPADFLAKKGFNSMWWSIENLKALGFSPNTIIDVGAYKGEWTSRTKQIFPDAKFLMVEAQPDKREILSKLAADPRITFVSSLAGGADNDEITFTVMKTGSSVYEQTYEGKANRSKVTLTSKRLDTIVKENNLTGEFFLKMDVQGYELQVLEGATKILEQVPVIMLEASLLNYNQGAPLVDEVIAYLHNKGYLLFDICELQRKKEDGVISQVDLIFCKENWGIRYKVNFKK